MDNLILEEKYILDKKIQEGRFGITYLASASNKAEKFIIKSVSLKKSDLVNKIPLLEYEAKIISNLNHPQIPKFIDFFTKEHQDSVDVYFVQEYIESKNLQQIIEEKIINFSESQIIKIALNVCNIFKYIHEFSPPVIHQDIKPANLLYTKDEKVYLIDFGAVKQKIISVDEAGLSTIIGTHGYMPIEQFEGRTVKGSDIYSLGLTLLYLITRKEPLSLNKKGLVFDLKNIDISDGFKSVLEKMLNPDWKKRYQNSRELEEDLLLISKNNKTSLVKEQKFYNAIKSELADNEKLKWFGRTDNKIIDFFYDENRNIPFMKVAMYSMIMFPFLLRFIFHIGVGSFFAIFIPVMPRFFIILAKYFRQGKETAIITDERIIIIKKASDKNIIKTYNHSEIKDVMIYERLSGHRGNILITRKGNYDILKLKYLENVDVVYKILKEIQEKNV